VLTEVDADSSVNSPTMSAANPSQRRLGEIEHLPIAVVTNLARYLEEIKAGDLWVVAADAENATPMWETDLSGGLAFVFGAEGKGLRPLVRLGGGAGRRDTRRR